MPQSSKAAIVERRTLLSTIAPTDILLPRFHVSSAGLAASAYPSSAVVKPPKVSGRPLVFFDATRLYRELPKVSQTQWSKTALVKARANVVRVSTMWFPSPSLWNGPSLTSKFYPSISSLLAPPETLNHSLVSNEATGSLVGLNGQKPCTFVGLVGTSTAANDIRYTLPLKITPGSRVVCSEDKVVVRLLAGAMTLSLSPIV